MVRAGGSPVLLWTAFSFNLPRKVFSQYYPRLSPRFIHYHNCGAIALSYFIAPYSGPFVFCRAGGTDGGLITVAYFLTYLGKFRPPFFEVKVYYIVQLHRERVNFE